MNDRPSPIAGSWYPGEAAILRRDLERYLAEANSSPPPGDVMAIVAPHAGYRYSARTAAYAFSVVRETMPEVVAVLSPLHSPHQARLLTSAHDGYATPLGRIEIDREALSRLSDLLKLQSDLELVPVEGDQEHSLEIELPFLQHLLTPFGLLPVMLRDQSAATVRALGEALARTLSGRRALVVASSDLSHFHPQAVALRLDGELLRRLEAFDPAAILEGERQGTAYACGRGAIAAALWATRAMGANRVTILHHSTSGDVTGDLRSVVGYGSAVVWRDRASA